jgi:hypothetical protein
MENQQQTTYILPNFVPQAVVRKVTETMATMSPRNRYLSVQIVRKFMTVDLRTAKTLAARIAGFEWSNPLPSSRR